MSTYYNFYTDITLDDIKNKTSIKVLEDDFDDLFLQDINGNIIHVDIEDNLVIRVTRYGQNNPTIIFDELVEKLNLKFLDEHHYEPILYQENTDMDKYLEVNIKKCMKYYGYE